MLGSDTPRGSERQDDLYNRQIHDGGEREAEADAQRLLILQATRRAFSRSRPSGS